MRSTDGAWDKAWSQEEERSVSAGATVSKQASANKTEDTRVEHDLPPMPAH